MTAAPTGIVGGRTAPRAIDRFIRGVTSQDLPDELRESAPPWG